MRKSTHTREYEAVLRKLVQLRHQAGLTQRDLAKKLDREPSFVWRIEKGERRLDVLELFWVCQAFGSVPESVYAELCAGFRACEYPKARSTKLKAAGNAPSWSTTPRDEGPAARHP